MSQLSSSLQLTAKEKKQVQKVILSFFVLVALFVTFFPVSLVWLLYIKKIKNYFFSHPDLLLIKQKFKEFALADAKRYQQSWYWAEYKKQKQEEVIQKQEEQKNTQSSFYEQNRKKLQEKFSENIDKNNSNTQVSNQNAWKKSVSSNNSKNNNFFGNNKKPKTFWSGKSIWDDYESVTEKFSSNKK